MQKVSGIGGVFFKANDPAALSEWYKRNLGVDTPPMKEGDVEWQQQAGPTVFAPMDVGAEHFTKHANLYINFRVDDLDAMCDQLQSNGVAVEKDANDYGYGRFASLEDPEGNQIQLWEVKPN